MLEQGAIEGTRRKLALERGLELRGRHVAVTTTQTVCTTRAGDQLQQRDTTMCVRTPAELCHCVDKRVDELFCLAESASRVSHAAAHVRAIPHYSGVLKVRESRVLHRMSKLGYEPLQQHYHTPQTPSPAAAYSISETRTDDIRTRGETTR